MRRYRVVLLALAAVVTACSPLGDDDGPAIPDSALPRIVLQPEDLSDVFTRFDEGPLAIADAPAGERADPARFGRTGGWKARYRQPGSAATRGPLVVESRADLFEGSGGASEEFDAHRGELELQARHPSAVDLVEIEQLGNEAVALAQDSDAPGTSVSHTIVWRYRNLSSSVTANGFSGKLQLADVVELARAQQRRIAAAAADES